MKRHYIFWLLGAFLVLPLTSCYLDEIPANNLAGNFDFTDAGLYYYHDDIIPGIGSYGISLRRGDPDDLSTAPYKELYLDFSSDFFEDPRKAVPAAGNYTYSDTYTHFTFNKDYSWYLEREGVTQIVHFMKDGKFSIDRDHAGRYSVWFNLNMADGSVMIGRYKGEISRMAMQPTSGEIHAIKSPDGRTL